MTARNTPDKPADDTARVSGGGDPAVSVDPAESGAASHEETPPNVDPSKLPKRQTVRDAFISPQQYADAGSGWEVGKLAPADRFRDLDKSTGEPTGKSYAKPKAGAYATQVAVKGAPVTPFVLDQVNAKD